MLAWGNTNIFDFKGRLVCGKVRLELLPALMSLDAISLLNPLGVTGMRGNFLGVIAVD